MTWRQVKDYIEKHMKVKNNTNEPIYLDHCNPDAPANILEMRHKITKLLRSWGDEKLSKF